MGACASTIPTIPPPLPVTNVSASVNLQVTLVRPLSLPPYPLVLMCFGLHKEEYRVVATPPLGRAFPFQPAISVVESQVQIDHSQNPMVIGVPYQFGGIRESRDNRGQPPLVVQSQWSQTVTRTLPLVQWQHLSKRRK